MEPTRLELLLHDVPHDVVGALPSSEITGICTDTRKLRPGDLFFALIGENTDGHSYVRQALDSGATAAVVSLVPEDAGKGPLIVVADTLRALGLAARNYRRRFQIPVIAITGSVGKTSVREMTAALLRTSYRTLASEKNFNNEIGVPLTLFELSSEHEAAVIEMGMRGAGEIDWLAEIAEPAIGLITNIGHSHLERLGSREGIASAKAEMLARLPADGVAILPRQDDYFEFLKRQIKSGCRIITYSDSARDRPDVSVQVEDGCPTVATGGQKTSLNMDAMTPHTARNAAAAIAAGLALDIPVALAVNAFTGLKPVEGRLRPLRGKNWITVLDDCYNAAPESMATALEFLSASHSVLGTGLPLPSECETLVYAKMRRVAVLGDMRELGEAAPELHRVVGRQVVDAGVHLLITVGELAGMIAQEAERRAAEIGKPAPLHRAFANSDEAATGIEFLLAPLDYILVKGSRAMEMEKIVAALTGEEGTSAHG